MGHEAMRRRGRRVRRLGAAVLGGVLVVPPALYATSASATNGTPGSEASAQATVGASTASSTVSVTSDASDAPTPSGTPGASSTAEAGSELSAIRLVTSARAVGQRRHGKEHVLLYVVGVRPVGGVARGASLALAAQRPLSWAGRATGCAPGHDRDIELSCALGDLRDRRKVPIAVRVPVGQGARNERRAGVPRVVIVARAGNSSARTVLSLTPRLDGTNSGRAEMQSTPLPQKPTASAAVKPPSGVSAAHTPIRATGPHDKPAVPKWPVAQAVQPPAVQQPPKPAAPHVRMPDVQAPHVAGPRAKAARGGGARARAETHVQGAHVGAPHAAAPRAGGSRLPRAAAPHGPRAAAPRAPGAAAPRVPQAAVPRVPQAAVPRVPQRAVPRVPRAPEGSVPRVPRLPAVRPAPAPVPQPSVQVPAPEAPPPLGPPPAGTVPSGIPVPAPPPQQGPMDMPTVGAGAPGPSASGLLPTLGGGLGHGLGEAGAGTGAGGGVGAGTPAAQNDVLPGPSGASRMTLMSPLSDFKNVRDWAVVLGVVLVAEVVLLWGVACVSLLRRRLAGGRPGGSGGASWLRVLRRS